LELEHERETRRLEMQERECDRQERERERQQQFELKKLELEISRASASPANPGDPQTPHTPPFRVEAAIKLIPKFTERDVETFLVSFEKIAELNAFPPDKYAAILQAHLTGKALEVFTELSADECRDYPMLKAALLRAYSVVPEVYRKRFRGLIRATRSHTQSSLFV